MNAKTSDEMLKPLLALELKRLVKPLRRLILLGGGLIAIGLWFNLFSLSTLFFILAVLISSILFMACGNILQDKLDGTMEFLVNLPVPASTLVLSRFVVVLICALGCSILLSTVLAVNLSGLRDLFPELQTLLDFRIALAAAPALWLVFSGAGWALVAAAIRFKPSEALTKIFLPAMALSLGLSWLGERIFGSPLDLLQRMIGEPSLLWFMPMVGVALCGLVMTASWFVAHAGMRRFRPEPDAMER